MPKQEKYVFGDIDIQRVFLEFKIRKNILINMRELLNEILDEFDELNFFDISLLKGKYSNESIKDLVDIGYDNSLEESNKRFCAAYLLILSTLIHPSEDIQEIFKNEDLFITPIKNLDYRFPDVIAYEEFELPSHKYQPILIRSDWDSLTKRAIEENGLSGFVEII